MGRMGRKGRPVRRRHSSSWSSLTARIYPRRIARGPIPLDQALPLARQIVDALDAAHEQGIIHRDLKPANVKVRADDTVKVLDFGLAKAMAPGAVAGANTMNSPTLSMHATQAGIILGTAAYMSPEQAAGRPVDKRSDLWAFGVVLLEMLTGRPVFTGETVSHVLASVLKSEPDWTALPASTPAPIRRLLRRCLDKDRKRRLDSAADARLEIDEALAPIGDAGRVSAPMPTAAWKRALPWTVAGTAVAGLMLALVLWAPWRKTVPPHVTRLTITTAGSALTIDRIDRDLALSPDGTHVVYAGNNGTQLFVRALESLEPVAIASAGSGIGIRSPFVSPDGQWVGFTSGSNTIQKVAITGGPPIRLATLDGSFRGGTWTPDDTIIFSTNNPATGLQRVSAAGGIPEVLTRPDHAQGEGDHHSPEILPGGRAVLFTITPQTGGLDTAQVAVRDLRTGTQKVLLRGGSNAHYVASGLGSNRSEREGGLLVYVAAGTLRAIAFDPTRLETHGSAVPVLPRIITTAIGTGDFDVATDGTLVYVAAPGGLTNERMLVWVDRTGKEEPVAAPPRAYQHPRLSPDGTRVALWSSDLEDDLWIWDLGRQTLTRLTLDPGQDRFPVWTPDGRRIIFSSNRGGVLNLWWQAADGTGTAERLTTSSNNQFLTAITPDGTAVVFNEATPTAGNDLLQLALDGTRRVTPLLQTQFDERNGIVSPDGRWLAYESNSSGRFEVFVRPFPNVGGGQWPVSRAGGTRPLWARNGKELFYVSVPVANCWACR
jgi:eukaryotic-like serine/threonine-protein kinase